MMLQRLRARAGRMEGDAGFSTLELVIITPFLLAFVLLASIRGPAGLMVPAGDVDH
jgi:hypothetical protein